MEMGRVITVHILRTWLLKPGYLGMLQASRDTVFLLLLFCLLSRVTSIGFKRNLNLGHTGSSARNLCVPDSGVHLRNNMGWRGDL